MQFGIRDYIAIFSGAFLQGATGFGGAVIMNAIMSLFHQIKTISPIIAAYKLLTGSITLIGRFIRGRLTLQTYRPVRSKKRIHLGVFLLTSIIGIYGGKMILLSWDTQIARRVIAGLILIGQVTSWYSNKSKGKLTGTEAHDTNNSNMKDYFLTTILGFGAGMFGYAYNTNGPFVALLILFQQLRKQHAINFSTLYFLGMNIIFLIMHNSIGLMGNLFQPSILIGFGLIIIGSILGVSVQKYISEAQYNKIINIFLIISIILLLL